MSQYARPDSDVSATNFAGFSATTPGSLHTNIDESSANDSDYIYTITTSASFECGLSDVSDPGVHTGHIFRWRVSLSAPLGGGDDPIAYTVSLYQGATLIASYSGSVGIATVAGASYTLSSGEAGAITDYADLRLRFAVASATSPAVRFTWAELEVPDAAPDGLVVGIDGADVVLEPADLAGNPGEADVGIDGADVVLEPADAEAGTIADIDGADIALETEGVGGIPGAVVVAMDGADVALDVAAIDPSYLVVGIDGVDVVVQSSLIDAPGEPTGPDPDPDPPTGPHVPGDESQRFVVLPKGVLISMPAENRSACEPTGIPEDDYAAGASFGFDLAFFDHTRPDGFREGWGPSNIRLGINSPYHTHPVGQDVGPPLYPYWWSYAEGDGETDGNYLWQNNPHVTSVASTFLVVAPGAIPTVACSPTDAERLLENYEEANQLAMFAGRDYYGWRVAGSDERYDGIVAYPFDAHDDTLIFTYRDGEASVRVVPVPHLGGDGASQMHASEYNCEREILRYNAMDPCTRSHGGRTRTNWPWEERPLYADGTLGEVCRRGKVCTETVTSCPDSTFCVQVGAAYDPLHGRLTDLRSGVSVLILDESGATVATGTTDASGYACFSLPGGNYYVKLRCAGSPPRDFLYWCDSPYVLHPCGKSLTVGIVFCVTRNCVTYFDFDTGAGVDGIWVGDECDSDSLQCFPRTGEHVFTGRDGSGRACRWGTINGICSLPNPPTVDYYPDPDWIGAACNPPGVILGKYLIAPDSGVFCAGADCCGTNENEIALYDRAKWTQLINWCGTYPPCQASSRHPAMVPRRLFASITAPDAIWKNLNGVPIPLEHIGVKMVDPVKRTCTQVWDSGCLSGAGQYWCSQYVWRAVPRQWRLVAGSTTNVDYAASRVRLFVQNGITRPGLLLGYRAGIIVENFVTQEDCEAVDPFSIPNDPGVLPIDTNRISEGGNPDCGPCINTEGEFEGQTMYCSGAQVPLSPPLCATSLFNTPYYGFMSCCVGRNGLAGCAVFTGPDCKGPTLSSPGCPTKSNALAGPINYSGTFSTCGAEEPCRWSASYDVFE